MAEYDLHPASLQAPDALNRLLRYGTVGMDAA